jgi:hypothetical protein
MRAADHDPPRHTPRRERQPCPFAGHAHQQRGQRGERALLVGGEQRGELRVPVALQHRGRCQPGCQRIREIGDEVVHQLVEPVLRTLGGKRAFAHGRIAGQSIGEQGVED